MLSMIPLLIHDADLPVQVRAHLREAAAAPSAAERARAQQAAGEGLVQSFGLECAEVKALLAADEVFRCAA